MIGLPKNTQQLMAWTWPQIEPFYKELAKRQLTPASVEAWLKDWSDVSAHVREMRERLYVATTVNTADTLAETRYKAYLDEIQPQVETVEQALKEKLLASGLHPAGFEIPLRNMRTEVALFRQANIPLFVEEDKLSTEYDKIVGAQTVMWEGKEITLSQLQPVYQDTDRTKREQAWRLAMQRWLADRDAINALWQKFLSVRRQIATNAGFGDDYRAFRWQQMLRFDYTPADCRHFHKAIEDVVVPVAQRLYEQRRQRLGVATLRPWDLDVDPLGRPPLRPFTTVEELQAKASHIFHAVDPQLGEYFEIMRREGLLDLENRKNKAPGGYCDDFVAVRRPFIFMNAVGLHHDVQTLLHEGGHAFHVFETAHLPYIHQLRVSMEFAEVASMGMELLASPYLAKRHGGFYEEQDAARAIVEHLEWGIHFWPFMAVVDAFQHWVYENPDDAYDPSKCDAAWAKEWRRFMPGVDWSGLEQEMMTGWHRKLHIHQVPFYYIEYGLAQMGAAQVWGNALKDQAKAISQYRHALALGGTVPLPRLYETAGATFAFDAKTLRTGVKLMEDMIEKLSV